VTLVLLALEDLPAGGTGAFYAALLGSAGTAYILSAAEDRPATDARALFRGAGAAVHAIAAKRLSAGRALAVYLAAGAAESLGAAKCPAACSTDSLRGAALPAGSLDPVENLAADLARPVIGLALVTLAITALELFSAGYTLALSRTATIAKAT
jgi:hypothetical protein